MTMEVEVIQAVSGFAESLSLVAFLLMALISERRRADRLEAKLITTLEPEEKNQV